jgi:hypothetical protein
MTANANASCAKPTCCKATPWKQAHKRSRLGRWPARRRNGWPNTGAARGLDQNARIDAAFVADPGPGRRFVVPAPATTMAREVSGSGGTLHHAAASHPAPWSARRPQAHPRLATTPKKPISPRPNPFHTPLNMNSRKALRLGRFEPHGRRAVGIKVENNDLTEDFWCFVLAATKV